MRHHLIARGDRGLVVHLRVSGCQRCTRSPPFSSTTASPCSAQRRPVRSYRFTGFAGSAPNRSGTLQPSLSASRFRRSRNSAASLRKRSQEGCGTLARGSRRGCVGRRFGLSVVGTDGLARRRLVRGQRPEPASVHAPHFTASTPSFDLALARWRWRCPRRWHRP